MIAGSFTEIRRFIPVVLLAMLAGPANAAPITTTFSVEFSADQSLWAAGPSFNLNSSGRFGSGSVGAYYDIRSTSGTVTSTVTGLVQARHPEQVAAGATAPISLSFLGQANGGLLQSNFGASAAAGTYLDITIGICPICTEINRTFPVISQGMFLQPTVTFTPVLDTTRSANDVDEAAGVGLFTLPVIGTIGPKIALDLDQSIYLTPLALNGVLSYRNRSTGETGSRLLSIPTASDVDLTFDSMGIGIWDFSIIDLGLENSFRNDIELDLRPTFDYIVGQWPPPGSELFSVGLVDETFALAFGSLASVGTFSLEVVARPNETPEPASLVLLALGLVALGSSRRHHT